MSKRPEIAPENCPEPFWHETHRYCPVCTWTAAQEEPPRKEVVGRLERIKKCHYPARRLPDSCILDGDPWPCERGWLVSEVERLRAELELERSTLLPRLADAEAEAERLRGVVASRPKIVCICGSTRFAEEMNGAAERETLAGRIVVRPEVVAYSSGNDPQIRQPEVKAMLDELHKRKIDLADEVLVVNVGGYVGESTRSEIAYAREHGKPIRWLEARAALEGKE